MAGYAAGIILLLITVGIAFSVSEPNTHKCAFYDRIVIYLMCLVTNVPNIARSFSRMASGTTRRLTPHTRACLQRVTLSQTTTPLHQAILLTLVMSMGRLSLLRHQNTKSSAIPSSRTASASPQQALGKNSDSCCVNMTLI